MSVIALVGNRGTGKTTLAANLAATLAQQAPTILLDADPRGGARHWRPVNGMASELPVLEAAWNLQQTLDRHGGRYQHLVIDCSPVLQGLQIEQALAASDIALVPVNPTPIQLWATVRVDRAIEQARIDNPQLAARLVINRLQPRARLNKYMRQGLRELDLPAFDTPIRERAVYATSVDEGLSVLEMGARGRAASNEIKQLITEVLTHERQRHHR